MAKSFKTLVATNFSLSPAGYTGSRGNIGLTGSQGPIGYSGSRGDTGLGFTIAKTYANVSALTADTAPAGISSGQFALIDTGNVEDAENSRLYLWNGSVYSYVNDLSGAAGIIGPQGVAGYTGSTGPIGYTGSGSNTSTEVSSTAPSSPVEGDLWLHADTGELSVYFGNAWAAISSGGGGGSVGFTGSAGTNGSSGYTGSAGGSGSTGFTGSAGESGSTGFTGSAGTNGSSGSAGGVTYTVVNSGASAYTIAGQSNPTLTLLKGFTYYFEVSAAGHPFWIKTSQTTGTGDAYNSGVTNNGTASGTVTFTVPFDAPATLYYICQFHSSMVGTINTAESVVAYNVNTTNSGFLAVPTGNTAQRPASPANGYIRYNTTTGYGEIYNSAVGQWLQFGSSPTLDVEYLVVAGGGGGSGGLSVQHEGGGGGAGGYLTGTLSSLFTGITYTVTVGAGGGGGAGGSYTGATGSNSVFNNFTANGGGYGAGKNTVGGSGGSGGGAWNSGGGSGTAGQGNAGANGNGANAGGGGGGAGTAGETGGTDGTGAGGDGGDGLQNSISGTAVYYAGGGGASSAGTGGLGGGGNGGSSSVGGNGTVNTGGGGGGGASNNSAGGSGGSGVVILKYLSSYIATFSGGLTTNTITSGSYKISTVTAGTGTVTFTIA